MAKDGSPAGWMSEACTLPTAEQPLRVAEFDGFFQTAVQRWTRPRATALDLVVSEKIESFARDLAEREASCCSFFLFDFEPTAEGLVMRIGVPELHVEVLDALQVRVSTLVGGAGTVNHHG